MWEINENHRPCDDKDIRIFQKGGGQYTQQAHEWGGTNLLFTYYR